MQKRITIGLGTVQIGLPYGNRSEESLMSDEAADQILDYSFQNGIEFIDTAPSYGSSEIRIGRFVRKHGLQSDEKLISTKTSPTTSSIYSNHDSFVKWTETHILRSLENLSLQKLGILQLHQSDVSFLKTKAVQSGLKYLQEMNYFRELGASIYTPEEAYLAAEELGVKYLQVPLNLVDQRFVSNEFSSYFKRNGIKLIARSIFLQGVLIEKADLPNVAAKTELLKLRLKLMDLFKDEPLSLRLLALQFVAQHCKDKVEIMLLGGDSVLSIEENLRDCKDGSLDSEVFSKVERFLETNDLNLIRDPRNWGTK